MKEEERESKGRILIIDDTPANLKVLIAVLSEQGYRVHAANEGQLGLRFLQTMIPDLILLDIRMPGMNGYEVCSKLKEDPDTRDIPVIFLSGMDQVLDKVKAFQCGGVDYIVKPFEPEEALARIETQLALRRLRLRLEDEVTKRTVDLIATMERLQDEIAERIEAQEALKKSEQRYRSFFEENPAGNYIAHADGRLMACNPAFLQMFGFESEEAAVQNNATSFYPNPGDREGFLQQLRQYGHVECYQKELLRQDGSPLYVVENALGVFDSKGELAEIHGFLIDETLRRKAEQQLQQAQKMEAVGKLAGGIAHDFNNILTVILGYDEFLLASKDLSVENRQFAQEIYEAGSRAANLTRQLLAFSRKQVLKPQILNLNKIIENIGKMISRLIGDEIEVKTLLSSDLENVHADPSQMEQVILNFCVNSRDAMPQGGQITIQTENVDVDEFLAAQHYPMKPGHYVRLVVSDTGTGMDKQTLSQVFEPFFTTKGMDKGTGLGLATVYGIVKQSGGFVWAYSELGRGSAFSVYLPSVHERAEVSPQRSIPQASLQGSETILIVEDATPLRVLIRKVMESFGYTVLEAECAEQAYEVAERNRKIDLLLTDLSLPRISGITIAETLLKARPGLKVLYMSAHPAGLVEVGMPTEGTDFIQKPFTQQSLAQKLRLLLDNGVALAQR